MFDRKGSSEQDKIINTALKKDLIPPLKRLRQENPSLILEYSDPLGNNIFQQAIHDNALNCLSYLLARYPQQFKTRDKNGNSLIQLAVRKQKPKILEHLLNILRKGFKDNEDYDLESDLNNEGESAFDVAEKQNNNRALLLLCEYHDPRTLTILPGGLTHDFYFQPEDLEDRLSVKGLALMLYYYQKKHLNTSELVICHGVSTALTVKMLAKTIDLFVHSDTENLLILFAPDDHKYVYKCEKYQGKIYIIILDSIARWDEASHFELEMKEHYPASLAQLNFCLNSSEQQSSWHGCSYYALKNINMLMKTSHFYKELSEGNYFNEIEPQNALIKPNFLMHYFFLPARFMRLATSPDQLENYIKIYPEEASKEVRITKQGLPQNFLAYSLHVRNRYGIKTPTKICNRHYNPKDRHSHEEKFISQNNSIWYFQEKLLTAVLPTLLTELDQSEMANLITYYNARNLELDAHNKIKNKAMIRSLVPESEGTFKFMPRAQSELSSIASKAVKPKDDKVRLFSAQPSQEEVKPEPPKDKQEKVLPKMTGSATPN